jgi:hypothetical protein
MYISISLKQNNLERICVLNGSLIYIRKEKVEMLHSLKIFWECSKAEHSFIYLAHLILLFLSNSKSKAYKKCSIEQQNQQNDSWTQ